MTQSQSQSHSQSLANALAQVRSPLLDQWRGLAFVLMVVYHICYDLNYYGILAVAPDHHLGFQVFRTIILSLFLTAVGISLVIAHPKSLRWAAFSKRLLRLGIAMALVSLGSWVMFPEQWIFFGVLHFIFVASVAALPLRQRSRLALLLALVLGVVWLKVGFSIAPVARALSLPNVTVDYVPFLPWFSVVLLGIGLGHTRLFKTDAQTLLPAAFKHSAALRWLSFCGRHALLGYLLHQPILLALLFPLTWL